MAQYHYSRGVAYAAKGNVDKSRAEQREFLAAKARVPKDALTGINPAHKVLSIAELVLEGEIAYREKRIDDAVAKLREAVTIEDDLLYMEPPEWILPVRHALGAVLVSADRHAEAEQVYRDDLKNWPENGWSLKGLATCQAARGASAEAEATEERLAKSWARADIKPGSSCLCVAESQQPR
jgi:tetratricopeptide (TPR) repeat protein